MESFACRSEKTDNESDEKKSDNDDEFDREFSLIEYPDLPGVPQKNPDKMAKTASSLGNSLGNSQNKTEFDMLEHTLVQA